MNDQIMADLPRHSSRCATQAWVRNLGVVPTGTGTYISGYTYTYKRACVINNPSGSVLTNSPVPIPLSASNFTFAHALSNGWDIRVTDFSGNILSHWVQYWNSTSGKATLWVLMPSLAASGNTSIWIYYGCANAVSFSNPAAVMAGASLVSGLTLLAAYDFWLQPSLLAGATVFDSSGNGNAATLAAGSGSAAGRFNTNSLNSFNGVFTVNSPFALPSGGWSFLSWFYSPWSNQCTFVGDAGGTGHNGWIGCGGNGPWCSMVMNSSGSYSTGANLPTSTGWVAIAAATTSSTAYYVNGSLLSTIANTYYGNVFGGGGLAHLDSCIIFSGALTAGQISTLSNSAVRNVVAGNSVYQWTPPTLPVSPSVGQELAA